MVLTVELACRGIVPAFVLLQIHNGSKDSGRRIWKSENCKTSESLHRWFSIDTGAGE